jgi:hypothetical protein
VQQREQQQLSRSKQPLFAAKTADASGCIQLWNVVGAAAAAELVLAAGGGVSIQAFAGVSLPCMGLQPQLQPQQVMHIGV